MMDSRERFFATLNREQTDFPASWLGMPEENAVPGILKHFNVPTLEAFKQYINDDIWAVDVPFNLPPAYHIAGAFNFAKKCYDGSNDERTLTAPGFFENYESPGDIEKFDWPDPAKYLPRDESLARVKQLPTDKIRMAMMWSAHFQDACSAFGMETALMKMLVNPEMFEAVINRIVKFYLKANEIFYEATKGYLDAVLIGNDFGTQTSLLIEPELLRQFVFNGTKQLVDQAKSYGLTVIHHSCGSIFPVIDDLISIGIDCIHPIQALAKDMEPEKLKQHFGHKVSFCGGVDAQELLVNGTLEDVYRNVMELKEIFPTGLIISPSHEAVLPDIAPGNLEALFNAVKNQE